MRLAIFACLLLTTLVLAVPPEAGSAVNGLRLQLTTAPEAWYPVGDPINVSLTVRNEADKEIGFLLDACCTFYDHVFVVNEKGEACKADMGRARMAHAGAGWRTVKAGGALVLPQTLNHWVVIDTPGVYTVWFEYAQVNKDLHTYNQPATPFTGKLVSNPITVTVISQADYVKRASGAIADGTLKGLSVTLASAKPFYAAGEALDFAVTLRNASAAPLAVPWEDRGRVARLDGTRLVQARQWVYRETPPATVTVPAGGEVTLPVAMSREHIGLAGTQRYRADLWTPVAPEVAKADGFQPVPPIRVVSAEITVEMGVREADLDRLLAAAAAELAAGKAGRNRAPSLDTLCAYLPAIAPWLPARAKGDAPAARLAADLLLARDARALLADPKQPAKVRVTAEDACVLEPPAPGALVGLTAPEKDAEVFARAYVRLHRCLQWLRGGLPTVIDAAPAAHSEAVLQLAWALSERAKAEGVYIYRFSVRLIGGKGWPQLDITDNMGVSMLLCVEGPMRERKTMQYDLLVKPQPEGNIFSMWDDRGLRQAMGGLRDSEQRFASADALAAYLAALPKRHHQAWIIALPGATWADINAGALALQGWSNVSMALAPSVPIQVWGE